MLPSISICIPAFKRKDYIKRLLDSVAIQTYKNFEVILTDDSPDDSIELLCNSYRKNFELHYFRNSQNLNTPENWNEAVRKSNFSWIKIMHDDDWFSNKESLQQFAETISHHPGINFFFSAYTNIYEGSNYKQNKFLSPIWSFILHGNIETLISRNVIGPPSVVLYRKNDIEYDKAMKYVVDIDFYSRYCMSDSWHYINQPLINVGINEAQVTKYTFGVADVQLRESLLMLEKKSPVIFLNTIIYDGWWRLIRNFNIKNAANIISIGYLKELPLVLKKMIYFQSFFSTYFLRLGIISKILMSVSYVIFRLSGLKRK